MAEVTALAAGQTRAGGALADNGYLRCAEAGVEKLATVGFDEIEMDLRADVGVARRTRGEEKQRIFVLDGIGVVDLGEERGRVGELALEVEANLFADGVAAGADAGADGGNEVFGAGAELETHSADTALDDAGEGASPAGVKGGDDATTGIGDENRDAVGGENGEENVGPGGDEGVAAEDGTAFGGGQRSCIRAHDANEGAVKLADRHKFARVLTGEGFEEACAISGDGFGGVVYVPAEVEVASITKGGGGASLAGAEAGAEPWVSLPAHGAEESGGALGLLRCRPGVNCRGSADANPLAVLPGAGTGSPAAMLEANAGEEGINGSDCLGALHQLRAFYWLRALAPLLCTGAHSSIVVGDSAG